MFLNSEMMLSVIQIAEMQTKAYREFRKEFEPDEVMKHTEIFMKSMFSMPIMDKKKVGD